MPQAIKGSHDRLFQELWSRPELERDFLRHYLPPEVLALVDLGAVELVKGSFVEQSLRRHRSDLLYKVKLRDGRPAFVYLLFEHKRKAERLTPFQLLRYLVQIADRRRLRHPGGELPLIVPLVVYEIFGLLRALGRQNKARRRGKSWERSWERNRVKNRVKNGARRPC